MRKAASFAIFGLILTAACTGAEVVRPATVDLNKPGTESRLRQSDPQEYIRVMRFVEAAETSSCGSKELNLVRASLEVTALSCGALLKTSFPPKRVVDFSTVAGRYTKLITYRGDVPRLVPLIRKK